MSTISQVAKQHLTTDDNVVQQYRSIVNQNEGALFLAKQRLLFIQSKGFLRKSYDVTLDLPYNTITNTSVDASHRFTITTKNDAIGFVTIGIQANIVHDTLQHLIESAKPKPELKATTVKVAKRTRKK